jgi:hypothetical protein
LSYPVKSDTDEAFFEIGIDHVFPRVHYPVKVTDTGRHGDGSRDDDRQPNVNLSSADTTGTEASPWEWFAASSSRLIARLFKALIRFFKP